MSRINIAGLVGNGELIGNAHHVDIGKSYNGSGDDAFGGADEWPTIRAEIGFQVSEERRALSFAKKLTELIESEFGVVATQPERENVGKGG